jgi:hypothetical protein
MNDAACGRRGARFRFAWRFAMHCFQESAMAHHRFSVVLPLVTALAILSGCAASGSGPQAPRKDLLGAPGAYAPGLPTVTITPATRWVNVTGGETVRFVSGARSFTWNFQVGVTVTKFDLNQVAPPGMLERPVMVYVAPNPLYLSNS